MFKNLKIQSKIIFTLVGVVFFCLSVAIGSSIFLTGNQLREDSLSIARGTAEIYAARTSALLNTSMNVAKSLTEALEATHLSGQRDRSAYGAILISALKGNENILGTWTAWEPNALDGRDKEFACPSSNDLGLKLAVMT